MTDTGTYLQFGPSPYICASGGRVNVGGQGADNDACSRTQLATNGPSYACCASGGVCAVSTTTCVIGCNPYFPCFSSTIITDPQAITWYAIPTPSAAFSFANRRFCCSTATCLTINIGGGLWFGCDEGDGPDLFPAMVSL